MKTKTSKEKALYLFSLNIEKILSIDGKDITQEFFALINKEEKEERKSNFCEKYQKEISFSCLEDCGYRIDGICRYLVKVGNI